MSYRLFLDDERFPKTDGTWVIARDFAQAIEIVIKNGFPSYVSFDHDLGDGPTGKKFADWLIDRDLDHGDMPADFEYNVHSANPIGRDNIIGVLDAYLRLRD